MEMDLYIGSEDYDTVYLERQLLREWVEVDQLRKGSL
jgi:hypothetical protein